MKRKAISKLIGAGLTVAFFALVRPSSVPGMGITSAFSIVMYEILSGFAHDIIGEHYIDVPKKINEKHGLRNWAKTKVGYSTERKELHDTL